jgi:hypothetical protein
MLVQADQEPLLTIQELDELLALSKRVDPDDRPPSDVEWEPTWDLEAGAAEGWRLKAGKVAGRFNVNIDGDSLMRAQTFSHCLTMADRYARRAVGSIGVRVAD